MPSEFVVNKSELEAILHIYGKHEKTAYSNELAQNGQLTQPTAWRCLQSLVKKGFARPLGDRGCPRKYELSELGKALAWYVQLNDRRKISIFRSQNAKYLSKKRKTKKEKE